MAKRFRVLVSKPDNPSSISGTKGEQVMGEVKVRFRHEAAKKRKKKRF